ncbi:MAG: hypothetical protein NC205_05510, partial [Prevotella sp.]|nr:hypothetical protein [Prevotella sp.]
MELLLKAQGNESVKIPLHKEEEENTSAPEKKIYVFNDYDYTSFSLRGSIDYVSDFYINDEAVPIKRCATGKNDYQFVFDKNAEKNSKDYKKIFMQCFGIVQIKIKISGDYYVSDSISIMVTDNTQYKNIIKMIDYIYDKGHDYLY